MFYICVLNTGAVLMFFICFGMYYITIVVMFPVRVRNIFRYILDRIIGCPD